MAARAAVSWSASCANTAERYWVPTSFPCRFLVVGSWVPKKTSSSAGYGSTAGSKVMRSASAWPVSPSHTRAYVGFGRWPPT